MRLNSVKSPITGERASYVESLDIEIVKKKYENINISVDRFFEGVESLDIYRCPSTGYRFYYPQELVGDQSFYEDLIVKRDNYYPEWRWENGETIKHLKSSDKVLEIGCGEGKFLSSLAIEGISVTGLEFNEKQVAIARGKNLNIHNLSIEEYAVKHRCEFDVVCYFQVLEHVPNVKTFIDSSLKALSPGGKLVISVPNSNPYLFKHDKYHALNLPPHHIGLWDRDSIMNLENHFPMKLKRISIQPLEEAEYYWKLKKEHLKNKSILSTWVLSIFPHRFERYVIKAYRRFGTGRNIFAIFEKL